MSEGGWQIVVHNSGTQSLRVTKCPLLTALISTLLRKLVRYADSNKTPEGACCHQRTLRNSKTLLYRIVNNTLQALLHFVNRSCRTLHLGNTKQAGLHLRHIHSPYITLNGVLTA